MFDALARLANRRHRLVLVVATVFVVFAAAFGGPVVGMLNSDDDFEDHASESVLARDTVERATGSDPFRVPDSWLKVRDKLDPQTPFNLVGNNDIVGGNSGSPMINAKGEVVGLMFDGNIHSISGSYWFDTEKNRSVAVHPAIMREALTKVYGATALTAELGIR